MGNLLRLQTKKLLMKLQIFSLKKVQALELIWQLETFKGHVIMVFQDFAVITNFMMTLIMIAMKVGIDGTMISLKRTGIFYKPFMKHPMILICLLVPLLRLLIMVD